MPAAAAIDAIHSGQAEVEEEDEEEEDKAEEEEEEEEFADARATNDESQEEEEDEEEEAEVVKTPEEAEVVKTPSHRKIRAAEDSYTVEERTRLQNEYPDGKLPNANEYTDGTYTLRNFVWTKEGSNMTKRERTHDLFVDTAAVYAKVTISTVDGDKILKWDHNINQGTLLSRMFTTVSDDTDILSEVLMTIQKYNTIPVEFPEFAAELKKKGIDLKYLKTAMKELGKKALAYDMVNAMEKRGLANNDEYVGGFYTSTENDFDDIIPKMETALKLLWVVMTSTVGKFGDTIALRQNAALTAITNGIANRFGKLGLHQESPIFAKWKEVLVTMNDLVRSDANTTEAPSFENDANNICRSGTSSENYKLLNGLTSFLMTEKNDVDRLADKYVSVVDIVWQFHKVRRFVIGHIRGGKPDDKSVNTQNHKFSAGDDCFETSDAVSRLARMFL
jgi:chemotaxis protein histidine kinase CheA